MRYGRRDTESSLREEKDRYQKMIDEEQFKLWSKSQLKSKVRNIEKKLSIIDGVNAHSILRTKEDCLLFAESFAFSDGVRSKMKSAEIPLPNKIGEKLTLTKSSWGDSFKIVTDSKVEVGNVTIQTRKNGRGQDAQSFANTIAHNYFGDNTHFENALMTATATVKCTFQMSNYNSFVKKLTEDEMKKIIRQNVYEELYDKLFSVSSLTDWVTDATDLKIEFIDKVRPAEKSYGVSEGIENNQIRRGVWGSDPHLQSPDRPIPQEEEREVA